MIELCFPQLRRWRIVRELLGPPTDAPSSILATIKASGDYSEAERMLEYNSVGRDVYNCLPFDSTFDFSLYRAEFNVATHEVATHLAVLELAKKAIESPPTLTFVR